MSAPSPVHVVTHSAPLREYFAKLSEDFVRHHKLSLLLSDDDGVECDDALFVGEDMVYILATDDGRFYAESCGVNPHEGYDVLIERAEEALDDLKAGVPIDDIVSPVPIRSYEGCYFGTIEEAVATAFVWIQNDLKGIPKEYHPPVQKER